MNNMTPVIGVVYPQCLAYGMTVGDQIAEASRQNERTGCSRSCKVKRQVMKARLDTLKTDLADGSGQARGSS